MGDIVLFSTADWDNPFWTNKQHVAVEFARLGHRVLYVDSIGLRRPSLRGADLTRIGRRLAKLAQPPRKVRDRLWVWSPVAVPLQGYPPARALNRLMLRSGLRFWIFLLGLKRPLLWTYNPLTSLLLNLNAFSSVVYHCVDEIKAQPGMPMALLEVAEPDLVRRSKAVFVTSPELFRTKSAWNAHTHYLPNVADFDHFGKARDPRTQVPDDLRSIRPPRLGFIGAISGYKVNFNLLQHVAEKHPEWSIVMIGKVGEGDPSTDPSALHRAPNIHLLGPRAYTELPSYLKGLDVALLPNLVNDYTTAMFPMKFFEYLAAGIPVVSTPLDSLREFSSCVEIAGSPDDFVAAAERVLEGKTAPLEQRLALAREHTYERRTRHMLEILSAIPD